MTRSRVAALSLFGAGAIAWAAIAFLDRDRSLERPLRSGVLRVAYAVEPPYAYVGADGQVTGESPELARRVIGGLGIPEVRFIQTEFGSLLPGLQAGRYDVVASGMFITPERARVVSFSIPTFRVRQGLLVREGNPRDLHSYRDAVASPEVRVAVVSGSVEETL
ncbi:MAG: transporter substrate-binding domain-containing protein, partial [Acidobacteria bacterium]|nr:transporter substrate-binding domain-containing protein [Acidobacteriota bacterium]